MRPLMSLQAVGTLASGPLSPDVYRISKDPVEWVRTNA